MSLPFDTVRWDNGAIRIIDQTRLPASLEYCRLTSVEDLQRGSETAWRHAYSVRSAWRRLRASPSPWPVRLGANLASRHYARNLHRFYTCDWMLNPFVGESRGPRVIEPKLPSSPAPLTVEGAPT